MLSESYFWKKELKKMKKTINIYNTNICLSVNFKFSYYKIESSILISAFIIRKLIESNKLTDKISNYEDKIYGYYPIKHIDMLHRYIEKDEYNWSNPIIKNVKLKDICNWIIHSYVLGFNYKNGKAIDILVSSDYDKNKLLYKIPLHSFFNYINNIISDKIYKIEMKYNSKTDDYICNNSN